MQPLFPSERTDPQPDRTIESRISKLEMLVSSLTEELSNSNETVSKLKKENSTLETTILKL